MTVYYGIRVSTRLLCSCKAYKYPHDVSRGFCSVELPIDLSSVPCKASATSILRAKQLIRDGYL